MWNVPHNKSRDNNEHPLFLLPTTSSVAYRPKTIHCGLLVRSRTPPIGPSEFHARNKAKEGVLWNKFHNFLPKARETSYLENVHAHGENTERFLSSAPCFFGDLRTFLNLLGPAFRLLRKTTRLKLFHLMRNPNNSDCNAALPTSGRAALSDH